MLGIGGLTSGDFATVVTHDRTNTKEQEANAQERVDVIFDRLTEQTHATTSQRGGISTLVDAVVAQVKRTARPERVLPCRSASSSWSSSSVGSSRPGCRSWAPSPRSPAPWPHCGPSRT